MKEQISYDDFAKLEICIGTVVSAELVPETDKLIKCTVNFGELGERTIVSGIAERPAEGGSASGGKTPADLIGKQFPYLVNLAHRVIRGIESEGMILAIKDKDGISLLNPDRAVESGAHIS
ncbi:MAG: hypothetical protein NUV88_02595 [Candidatus Kaiserbacteria bacterium]|nr:hypothetical protein [Candidatus Kaiserbacteria bacterium]